MNKIDYKSAYESVLIANGMLRQQNKQLHNKINKAIEYINDIFCCIHDEELLDDLLGILKDSDVDE